MSFREYELVNLGDIAFVTKLAGFEYTKYLAKNFIDFGIPIVQGRNIKDGSLNFDNMKYISLDLSNQLIRSQVNKDTILLSYVGTVGEVYHHKKVERLHLGSNVAKLEANQARVSPSFLYYVLKSPKFKFGLFTRTKGSVQKNISMGDIRAIEISLPKIEIQNQIAHILSTLDEKIEVNNQINKTLEAMAQALFKHWFIDFEFPNENGEPYKSSGGEMVESALGLIPKGWEVSQLADVVDFQNGYAFKSNELIDEHDMNCYHVFKMGHIKKGGGLNKSGTKSYFPKDKCSQLGRYIIKKGDLLMCMTDMKSNVALLGHTALMDESDKYILNQRVGLIRVKEVTQINYPYLYILTNQNDFIENLRSRANSGVQVNLSTKEIKESKLILPHPSVHSRFNSIVEAIYEKSFIIGSENERLTIIRDSLLPKLMSGEIRVPVEEN